jgi:glycerol-3-phosphate dehydrogenase
MGLEMYDIYSGDAVPAHRSHQVGAYNTPPINPRVFNGICSYYDAQVHYPERFVLAMLADCRQIAAEKSLSFELLPYHRARMHGSTAIVESATSAPGKHQQREILPRAVLNATGAWVDHTLQSLAQTSQRLIGGTKGSHLFVFHAGLQELLHGKGVYVEADDGRPIFILPLGKCVLVGTTDEPFEAPPETAVATEPEVDYLLRAVATVFPQAGVSKEHVNFHGCGVRPLPFVDASKPSAITRRHSLHFHDNAPVPLWSVIGGKLTTCRSLAEETAITVLKQLDLPHVATSRERRFPGNADQPAQLSVDWAQLAKQHGVSHESIEHVWSLVGTRTPQILAEDLGPASAMLPDAHLPERIVRWSIRNEWVTKLDDLVERRLMLLFHQTLSIACLKRLAAILTEEGKLAAAEQEPAVQQTAACLRQHFGKVITS